MSLIPKLIASKENRPLSNIDKKSLILNNTRPLKNAASTSAPEPRLKRGATVPVPVPLPAKCAKVEKTTVAPKIPSYDYKARFNNLLDKHRVLKTENNDLKDENEDLHRKTKLLEDKLDRISVDHDKLRLDYKEASKSITKNKDDVDALLKILSSMYKEQRDLRNTIQDLKGNIQVYCRVLPPLESERNIPLFNLNVLDACSIEVEKIKSLDPACKEKHSFSFDGIFTPDSSQEDVFTEVSAMIQSALDGYNVCIFSYGQTYSGKSYTMKGTFLEPDHLELRGIAPRAFTMIIRWMEDLKRMGCEVTIRASFLDIYNEIIYDLLNSSEDQPSHDIKMVNSKDADVYVSNLKEEEVTCSHGFIRLYTSALDNRQTAVSLNNERRSRSHFVAQIKMSVINEKRKEKYTSNLSLVDLAGSKTELGNRSLPELSKVIQSLQTNKSIPYTNSKLTQLLMPSLGGNSKTLMLVNINQFDEHFDDTLNSLQFATQINSYRTIKAKKNLSKVDSL